MSQKFIMNLPLIAITVLYTLTSSTSALKCYSCEGTNNHPCVVKPNTAKIITCLFNQQCYALRKESTGSFVSIKRGCGRSVGAVATSSGGNGVSTSVQSCSTDLCNSGDGLQNFNINDFISNFNIPNVPGSYPNNPGYPAGAVPGNDFNFNFNGYPSNYPFYPNYLNGPFRPDPFLGIINSALNNQWQNLRPNRNFFGYGKR